MRNLKSSLTPPWLLVQILSDDHMLDWRSLILITSKKFLYNTWPCSVYSKWCPWSGLCTRKKNNGHTTLTNQFIIRNAKNAWKSKSGVELDFKFRISTSVIFSNHKSLDNRCIFKDVKIYPLGKYKTVHFSNQLRCNIIADASWPQSEWNMKERTSFCSFILSCLIEVFL